MQNNDVVVIFIHSYLYGSDVVLICFHLNEKTSDVLIPLEERLMGRYSYLMVTSSITNIVITHYCIISTCNSSAFKDVSSWQ